MFLITSDVQHMYRTDELLKVNAIMEVPMYLVVRLCSTDSHVKTFTSSGYNLKCRYH